MSEPRLTVEQIDLRLQMLYASKRTALHQLYPGVNVRDLETYIAMEVDHLVMTMTALVAGREGPLVEHTAYVEVTNFPRWLPKWLRRRWTRTATHYVNATGSLIFPELSLDWHNQLGRSVRIARFDGGGIRP